MAVVVVVIIISKNNNNSSSSIIEGGDCTELKWSSHLNFDLWKKYVHFFFFSLQNLACSVHSHTL